MGSFISSQATYTDKNRNKLCFLCSKQITGKTYTICVQCNILLHNDCEAEHTKTCYTICPRCDRCGSLGKIIL